MSSLHDVLDTVIDYIPGMPQNVKDWARGAVSADRPAAASEPQSPAEGGSGAQGSDGQPSAEAPAERSSEPQPSPVVALPQREADGGPAPLAR